jgi:hypothetical protein
MMIVEKTYFCSSRYFGDITLRSSSPSATNTVPISAPSGPPMFQPPFSNPQYTAPPTSFPPPQQQQQQPPMRPFAADQYSSMIPPPAMPPFNFPMPNPQQQHPQQQYFQPVPPTLFGDYQQQQQQQQQPPYQFNPSMNAYSNPSNTFSVPPPTFGQVQQPARASPAISDHHGHSHDHDGSGHGHSHDHGGHGHSHDH